MLSVVIYVAVGYHVFHQRNQLRNLTLSNQARDTSGAAEKVCVLPVLPSPPSVILQSCCLMPVARTLQVLSVSDQY